MKAVLATLTFMSVVLVLGQFGYAQGIDFPAPPLPDDSSVLPSHASPAERPQLVESVRRVPRHDSNLPIPLPVVDVGYESHLTSAPIPEAADYAEQASAYAEQAYAEDDDDDWFSWAPFGCTTPVWRFYGEFLYIRARDAEVPYAVPINAVGGNPPIQVGPTAVVDPQYEPGFRVGFGRAWDECSHLKAEYTHYESNIPDQATATAPNVLRSLALHPSTAGAATDWLGARANYGIDFDLADLDYRRIIDCGDLYTMRYLVGLRYASLRQDFRSEYLSLATATANTDVNFDGGGIRVGIEGERHAPCCGLMLYGRATASFVAGDFRARYEQRQLGVPIVYNNWKAGRVVTMLDLEVGIGWVSKCDTFRFNAGYLMSGWYNTVTTSEYIGAVQANDFGGLGDRLSFDGLTARVEMRF